jgi:hypothetical protein
MSRQGCINNPDKFCFICGKFVPMKQRRNVTAFVKKACHAYFGTKLGDQEKIWAPHKACRTCIEQLQQWMNGERNSLPFAIPMVWHKPSDHRNNCYFCSCSVKGYNTKNKTEITYPNIWSAILRVPQGPEIPIPSRPENLDLFSLVSDSEITGSEKSDSDFQAETTGKEPKLFTQSELNDLVRDLGLPKDLAEILGSRLFDKKTCSAQGLHTIGTDIEKRNSFLIFLKKDLSYIATIFLSWCTGLDSQNMTLVNGGCSINTSKRSLKGVLFHNGNVFGSVPVAHSVFPKDSYENLETLILDQVPGTQLASLRQFQTFVYVVGSAIWIH